MLRRRVDDPYGLLGEPEGDLAQSHVAYSVSLDGPPEAPGPKATEAPSETAASLAPATEAGSEEEPLPPPRSLDAVLTTQEMELLKSVVDQTAAA